MSWSDQNDANIRQGVETIEKLQERIAALEAEKSEIHDACEEARREEREIGEAVMATAVAARAMVARTQALKDAAEVDPESDVDCPNCFERAHVCCRDEHGEECATHPERWRAAIEAQNRPPTAPPSERKKR